ncbi:MAG: EutN/CcmL family microcompartment protein [Spirochaetes bacterium]|nr:EutN/CcmL family microcompartment protein [Spirochaetota bacterium]
MKLGKIIGSVVCTTKIDPFEGKKLLLLTPINEQKEEIGDVLVAIDTVQAGTGDLVFYEGGKEAGFALGTFNPSDATIIGIVDQLNCGEIK